MRRGAVTAGIGAALTAVAMSGCAAFHPLQILTKDRKSVPPGRSREYQQVSRAAQEAIDRHDDGAARSLLERLVALEPRSPEASHRLGRILQAQGRAAEAAAAYRRALELDHEYLGAMTGLGLLEDQAGRPLEALKRFDEAIELDPHQAEAHEGRGRALEALGRTDDAVAAYFRALQLDPNSAEVRRRVATLQLARNEPDQALARLDPLVEQDPEDAEARHQRGRAHLALGHRSLALDDLRRASAQLSDRPDVQYHLALALAADHRDKDALAAAERALQLAPDYADARALTQKLRR